MLGAGPDRVAARRKRAGLAQALDPSAQLDRLWVLVLVGAVLAGGAVMVAK